MTVHHWMYARLWGRMCGPAVHHPTYKPKSNMQLCRGHRTNSFCPPLCARVLSVCVLFGPEWISLATNSHIFSCLLGVAPAICVCRADRKPASFSQQTGSSLHPVYVKHLEHTQTSDTIKCIRGMFIKLNGTSGVEAGNHQYEHPLELASREPLTYSTGISGIRHCSQPSVKCLQSPLWSRM